MADTSISAPLELSTRAQWVVWRYERRSRESKPTKAPYRAKDGRRASSTDPGDWCTLSEAISAQKRLKADGIGFVFSSTDPYCGIDLDDCFQEDGTLHPEAKKVVESIGSYAEVSPSGSGVHVIARAEVGPSGRRTPETPWGGNLEAYDSGRYFTFTGQPFEGFEDVNETVLDTRQLFGESVGSGAVLANKDWLSQARENPKFVALYDDGDLSDYEDDHSAADMALMNYLVDAIGIEHPRTVFHAFKQSALYRGDKKAGGDDYVLRTLEKVTSTETEEPEEDGFSPKTKRQVSQELQKLRVRDEARRLRTEEVAGAVSLPEIGELSVELQMPEVEEVYRIDQLHPAKGNVLLVARQKSGKTTLTLNLLRSLADEMPFLGKYEVTPFEGNILVVNYEETQQQWIRHVRKLNLARPDRIKTLHRRGQGIMPLWDKAYRRNLVEQMKRAEISYWIMDPAAVAWQGLVDNENDNALMTRFTVALDEVKYEAGIQELLLTHHSGRADDERGRGASRLEDWMDAGWYLTRNDAHVRELWALGRDVSVDRFALDWDETKWALVAGETQAEHDSRDEVAKLKDFRRTVLEILLEAGVEGMTKTKVYEVAHARGVDLHKQQALKKLEQYALSPSVEIEMRPGARGAHVYFHRSYVPTGSDE